MIDYLQEDLVVVAYFFCEPSIAKTLESQYLVASLTQQLLSYTSGNDRAYPHDIRNELEHFYSPKGPEPDWEDTKHLFLAVALTKPHSIFIIDGLDEMKPEEISPILSVMYLLIDANAGHRVMVASRKELGFNVRISFELQIGITAEYLQTDIRTFIETELLRNTRRRRHITDNNAVLVQIKQRLLDESIGM